jgi:23S rRNA pseudouridine1911/1915/1917 synthase
MRHMTKNWTIDAENAGKRLDVFLAEELVATLTRSGISKQLKAKKGRVNDKIASVHRFLKIGDKVEFDMPEKQTAKAIAKEIADIRPLNIIEETPEFIVIDKPTGLLVHPDVHHAQGTLVDALVAHDPKIGKIGEDPSRPGIMHRLDKEVSGLMVIAKTQDAFDSLKKQFAEHTVDKRYLALVHGEMRQDEGDIKFRIARSTSKGRMAAHPESEEVGRAAWTHYKTLQRFHNATLVELNIFSGRTHQIRAHMLAFSHPVIGDTLYKRRLEDRKIAAPRLMLQSIHLSFIDPSSGERRTYDLPPVKEFDVLTKQFKSSSQKVLKQDTNEVIQ